MQQEAAIIAPGRQCAKALPEVPKDARHQPQENQERGNAALGGVVQIDVVKMNVRAYRQRPRNIGGDVLVEMDARHLGTQSEPGMLLDHTQSGAPGDLAKVVRIRVAGPEDGGETLTNDR